MQTWIALEESVNYVIYMQIIEVYVNPLLILE